MWKFAIKLVIFDLVGTTIRDCGEVAEALRSAFQNGGINYCPSDLTEYRGRSKSETIRLLLEKRCDRAEVTEMRIQNIYQNFQDALELQYRGNGAIPVAGVEDFFKKLLNEDIKIAITTGTRRFTFLTR